MPERGTDGFERADLVEGCLAPMETWIEGKVRAGEGAKDVAARLGEPDPTKVFLASLLVSLLRAQALSARKRADRRAAK